MSEAWRWLQQIRCANPERLWWLIVVAAAALLLPWYAAWQRRIGLARLGDVGQLARLAATVSAPRRWIKAIMVGSAALLLTFAVARP